MVAWSTGRHRTIPSSSAPSAGLGSLSARHVSGHTARRGRCTRCSWLEDRRCAPFDGLPTGCSGRRRAHSSCSGVRYAPLSYREDSMLRRYGTISAFTLGLLLVPALSRLDAQAVCKDGTTSATTGRGACSGQGGVDTTAKQAA